MVGICLLLVGTACGEELGEDATLFDRTVRFVGPDGEVADSAPQALLVVDGARTGTVDLEDPLDLEYSLDPPEGYGALFLANLDDDAGRCRSGQDNAFLWNCSDADLDYVANDDDLKDMARIIAAPTGEVTPGTVGLLTVDEASRERVRLYRRIGDGDVAEAFEKYELGSLIYSYELADGVEFAMEGLELVEDLEEWDGRVELTWELRVPETGTSTFGRAELRQAPVLLRHHMDAARIVYAAHLGGENAAFRNELNQAVQAAGVPDGLRTFNVWDPWTQDHFENAYMAMPGPDGPQAIQVYFRSPNLNYPGSLETVVTRAYQMAGQQAPPMLREAGVVVHTELRGAGTAGLAIFDPDKGYPAPSLDGLDLDDVARYLYNLGPSANYPAIGNFYDRVMYWDTMDSMGNTETVPPHVAPDGSAYPNGRVIRGRGAGTHVRPDPRFSAMIDAQGEQETIWFDTEWLVVAHIDETLSFVEAPSERGWAVIYADPQMALEMFQDLQADGHGNAVVFEGKTVEEWSGWNSTTVSGEYTVNEILNDSNVMSASARAIVEVDAQLEILRDQVGITEEDLHSAPFLFEDLGSGLVAFQPGLVNGISLRPDAFGPPRPHGPRIDGQDVFKTAFENILANLGVDVHWIENWDVYHTGLGEVHCGSNTERFLPETPWWALEVER